MKRIYRIAGIMVVLGLALFFGAFAAAGFNLNMLSTAASIRMEYTPEEAFNAISIVAGEADIAFLPAEDGICRVVCTERDKVHYEVTVKNGMLNIAALDGRAWYDHIGFFPIPMTVRLYLPEKAYESVTVAGGTGDVSADGPFTFGGADIHIRTGSVSWRASTEGQLRILTTTGDVDLVDISAGSVEAASTSSGDVRLRSVTCGGDVKITTGTGSAHLESVVCKNLTSDGITGDITLKDVLASNSFDIQQKTGNVRFTACDAEDISVVTSTGDVTGTFRTGKVFSAQTNTGSVNVPDTTSGGQCEISTRTGDISIGLTK